MILSLVRTTRRRAYALINAIKVISLTMNAIQSIFLVLNIYLISFLLFENRRRNQEKENFKLGFDDGRR